APPSPGLPVPARRPDHVAFRSGGPPARARRRQDRGCSQAARPPSPRLRWSAVASAKPDAPPALLDFDLGADFLELLLDGLGLFLRDPFLDRLGRALDEVLGFLQPEIGDLAHDLDDVDLVAAHVDQG